MSEIPSLVCRLVFQLDNFTSDVFFSMNTALKFCPPSFVFFPSAVFPVLISYSNAECCGWTGDYNSEPFVDLYGSAPSRRKALLLAQQKSHETDSLLFTVLSRITCQGLGMPCTSETYPCSIQTSPGTTSVWCLTLLKNISGRNCFVGRRQMVFRRNLLENQHYCREIFLLYQLFFILLVFMRSCFVHPPAGPVQSAFSALLLQHGTGSFITWLLNSGH